MYHNLWNLSILLLLLGAVLAAAGAVLRVYSRKLLPYPATAEARVVDIVAVPREGRSTRLQFQNSLAAVLEFYADGRPVKVRETSDTYPCPYHINERVRISYDPEEPEHFEILKPNRYQILASQCSVFSMVLILAGCAVFLVYAGFAGRADGS